MSTPGVRPAEDAAHAAQLAAEAEVTAAAAQGNLAHEREVMAHYGDVPSPAAAVKAGVTESSGEGHGPWPRRPI